MATYLNSIGTASPENQIPQSTIAEFMKWDLSLNSERSRELDVLYRASGIKQRHSVIPDFQFPGQEGMFFGKKSTPTLKERMEVFEKEAPSLSMEAIKGSIPPSQLSSITHIITVSCTGMYAPGLDLDIIRQLGLSTSIQRTAVNFMGCYGVFNALKLAHSICQSNNQANVLVVSVELCTLHFQRQTDLNTTLAQALFSDGAAACLVSNTRTDGALEILNFQCEVNFDGIRDMSWRIGADAFNMVLTRDVPNLIRKDIRNLSDKLLRDLPYKVDDISNYAIHPGGRKILTDIEEVLGIPRNLNAVAHEVLKNYGNMSSTTILFVLRDVMNNLKSNETVMSMAFGPGLTMESMLLKRLA